MCVRHLSTFKHKLTSKIRVQGEFAFFQCDFNRLSTYKCSNRFTVQGAGQCFGIPQVHHENGKIILHTKCDGSDVHEFETAIENIDITQRIKFLRIGILLGVGVVDTVHLCGFDDHLCVDLGGA